MIACDECISVKVIVSTKMTNTVPTIVTKKCDSKKVGDCYVLQAAILAIILMLIILIIWNYYAKDRSKPENILPS